MQFLSSGFVPDGYFGSVLSRFRVAESYPPGDVFVDVKLMDFGAYNEAICIEVKEMQISEAAGGQPAPGAEPCRFPKLEECAHFHYERVQLSTLSVSLRTNMDQSLHSQHTNDETDVEWYMIQVTSGEECWLLQRNFENFKMLDDQLHQCIYDRKISQLPDLSLRSNESPEIETILIGYLERFSEIADNSLNCGPVLNWLQMDNKGHRLLVPSEESRSINTPAVAAAYSVRRYVSQARDELNLEVGDMISVIDMASPGESMWWRGKRGFQVGFFPQHCVHIIGDKVPRNMPLPPPVVGPSRRRLKQSGILKERVFACDLGEHLLNSGHEIPMVLKCCAEFIEKNGIVDGIYRLSGVTSNIQKLRNAFDEDRIPNLYTEEILQDIHSVASLLKMYFRELPNPLCTYQLYQSFVTAVQHTGVKGAEGDHERLLKMREAVQKLPPPHYRTLEYLMRHLARVAKHGPSTGMTTRNVAIVWAPNLLRCAELEDGGVTALQGVGVQAVVTEFLICFADLIFCDHLPNLDKPILDISSSPSPRKCRPKSLAISTPTKLITLEEARSKHLLSNRNEECQYIEVGGGPKNLPKKYHTVIDLPPGSRKRGHTKRSPMGWRSFFGKSRSNTQTNLKIARKSSTPGLSTSEKAITTEPELMEVRRKLRSVKSAESLTSGHSEPAPADCDVLAPLHSLHKPPGHNRSISHDSYFDTLQNSQNNSEGSLLDLSEIQLNFDLEETEMRIFSEDESLVSSPKVLRETNQRRVLTRARPEEFNSATNSGNPSPKKQARVVLSPDSVSRKRTRLEDQLSDIQYIDCSTPENVVSTIAVVHSEDAATPCGLSYQPKNKSPRNSDNNPDKRQSLNLDSSASQPSAIVKSFTENDIAGTASVTPQSPAYRPLGESSTNTTSSPTEVTYQNLHHKSELATCLKPATPTYENVLTTISITYKSPQRSAESSPLKTQTDFDSIYEDVTIIPEKAVVPTSTASLPIQQASQPELREGDNYLTLLLGDKEDRPKSLSALDNVVSRKDDMRTNLSSSVVYDTNEQLSLFSAEELKTFSSNRSSGSNIQYTPSSTSAPYQFIENTHTPSDLSLSEVLHSSTDNLSASQSSLSFPNSSMTPNVSPTPLKSDTQSLEDLLTPVSPLETRDTSECSLLQEIQSEVMEAGAKLDNLIDFSPSVDASLIREDDCESSREVEAEEVYEQVKYFRRSINEVNSLLELQLDQKESSEIEAKREVEVMDDGAVEGTNENEVKMEEETPTYDSLEPHVYENLQGEDMRKDDGVSVYENVEIKREPDQVSVKDLLTKFGECKETVEESTTTSDDVDASEPNHQDDVPANQRLRKFYEKDSLPPCLRARNLKNQLKTRSLDEEEFKKEFDLDVGSRRKSLDEALGYKTNSLPKTLNQPKMLPQDEVEREMENFHLLHGSENDDRSLEEEMKKRERIEKYKEERRKILQEKYRTESFKEDKDVLLSRMKIYKSPNKEDSSETSDFLPCLNRVRRKSTRSDDSVVIEPESPPKPPLEEKADPEVEIRPNSLKARAAMFERNSTGSPSKLPKPAKKTTGNNRTGELTVKESDKVFRENFILRSKTEDIFKGERRRHTYESRERQNEDDLKSRRGSLDRQSPRKEKTASPSYCIKDMKAIFESKSKQ
ncbi:GTPase-activating protein CdGAPr-like isoform X2 [Coccinella septempunctata]|uniref:GTPase-activating protein CdGAPr-like isoform X2 n=1 Tax=Coccinella septempunctata TaxID=41139 RepID=UPI001D06D70F|nr:GTPase-activating protein CdGAPr-like isoform X2 [Coccinella septempunctata]